MIEFSGIDQKMKSLIMSPSPWQRGGGFIDQVALSWLDYAPVDWIHVLTWEVVTIIAKSATVVREKITSGRHD